MDSIVRYVVSELSVIAQAPVAFFLCLAALSGLIWKAVVWRFAAVIDAYEARNKLQADQLADYKTKLNGSSPDEAKEKLISSEKALDALAPRSLPRTTLRELTRSLAENPGRIYLNLAVTSPNAKLLFSDLDKCFTAAEYEVQTWVAMQTKMTHEKISLKVPNVDSLTARQDLVLRSLRAAGLEIIVEHEPNNAANTHPIDIWLVVR